MTRFTTIVVGYEETARAAYAAWQAVALARRHGAEVVLVHSGTDRAGVERMRERLAAPDVRVSHAVTEGDPATALTLAAHQRRADLIVVGSHGRTGVRRLLLGSVAEKLVQIADVSVLVTRGEPVAGGFERIVVGTDLSPYSLAAVECAIAVARVDATIDAVHFWRVAVGAVDVGAPHHQALADLRTELAALADEKGRGLLAAHRDEPRLRFRALEGAAAEGIVAAADDDGADLVVVGSHGYRGVRRAVLGSVAETVVRHAPCAVLVAR